MTKDKFNSLGCICCDFQRRILAQIADEPAQQDHIDAAENCKVLTHAFSEMANAIQQFLEEAKACINETE